MWHCLAIDARPPMNLNAVITIVCVPLPFNVISQQRKFVTCKMVKIVFVRIYKRATNEQCMCPITGWRVLHACDAVTKHLLNVTGFTSRLDLDKLGRRCMVRFQYV